MKLVPTAAFYFTKAVVAAGRTSGPAMLSDWWYGGKLTVDELRAVITDVWSMAEWPEAALGRREWVTLFRTAGFVADDGQSAPTEPLTIYRGSTWGRRRGMAWTEDREQAEWFAGRWRAWGTGDAVVFETKVKPDGVLALIGMEGGRNEAEVVVDPAMLPPIRRPRADKARTDEVPPK